MQTARDLDPSCRFKARSTLLSGPLKASPTFLVVLDATFSFKKHPRSLRVLHTQSHDSEVFEVFILPLRGR